MIKILLIMRSEKGQSSRSRCDGRNGPPAGHILLLGIPGCTVLAMNLQMTAQVALNTEFASTSWFRADKRPFASVRINVDSQGRRSRKCLLTKGALKSVSRSVVVAAAIVISIVLFLVRIPILGAIVIRCRRCNRHSGSSRSR